MADPVIEFKVDTTAILRLAAACPEAVNAIAEEMRLAMEESGMLLTTMTAARTPVNYGLLRASIMWPKGFEMSEGGSVLDSLRGIVGASDFTMAGAGVSTREYVAHVEWGTRPHWPPLAPLKLWAARKFGDENIGRLVQFKIARKGTQGAHMFQRAWDEGGREKVTRIWQRVPVKALKRFESAAM